MRVLALREVDAGPFSEEQSFLMITLLYQLKSSNVDGNELLYSRKYLEEATH